MPYIGNQPGTGVRSRFIYTATASQTTFSGADDNSKTLKYADSDYIDVYLNGVCLVPGTDYTASTKTSVVLTQAASLNDTLEVVAYDIATIADTVSKADGGNFVKTVSFSEDVLIGKTEAETTISGATPALQVTGAGFDAAAAITRREANAFGASMVLAKSRNTDSNSFTIVQDDDVLGSVIFIGDDGTNLDTYGAAITASVDGTPGANDLPARLTFSTTADGAASPTERMRIANNGKVGIGSNTAASHTFSVNKAEAGTIGTFYDTGSNGGALYSVDPVMAVSRTSNGSTSNNGPLFMVGRDNNETATFNIDASIFEVGSDEIVVNESSGDIDFRVESNDNANMLTVDAGNNLASFGKFGGNSTVQGVYHSNSGSGFFHSVFTNSSSTDTHSNIFINRQSSDGQFIQFRQADSTEGTISVSGSTVSYNGFSGRHESSGIPTNTPVGTVVSTIDELDVYPNTSTDIEGNAITHKKAGQTRADHAKVEVSSSEGDTCVYGVVSEFDDDDKVIVTSVGIGSVRVTGACSKGDLLESNGDGTAKVQSDDIIRSKTIGKVTIGNSSTDVKLVSCVMYCG
tara:strand:- start:320 stop:2044 length:1725 start_codon:yes stop_codon:yes gene_type:complete